MLATLAICIPPEIALGESFNIVFDYCNSKYVTDGIAGKINTILSLVIYTFTAGYVVNVGLLGLDKRPNQIGE